MYFLVIIQNYSTPAIYSYQTKSEALSAFHNELAYRNEARSSTVCILLDRKGNEIERNYYDATDVEN